jgi:hypothetical protein
MEEILVQQLQLLREVEVLEVLEEAVQLLLLVVLVPHTFFGPLVQ